jgi:iron complex transport system ATP-binding protein
MDGVKVLTVEKISFSYGEGPVLQDVSFSVGKGEMMGIVGPNGSGKSTLIGLISGILKAARGKITVMDRPLEAYSRRELSLGVAAVTQNAAPVFPYTVEEIVAMGRYPHLGWSGWLGKQDREACGKAMELTAVAAFRNRTLDHLSAGERQRVLLARALAQEPEILLLDEAASFLDIGQEQALFQVLDRLRREEGLSLLTVSHDLNLVGRFCQRVLLLREGTVLSEGELDRVYTAGNLSGLFGVQVQAERRPDGGVQVSW